MQFRITIRVAQYPAVLVGRRDLNAEFLRKDYRLRAVDFGVSHVQDNASPRVADTLTDVVSGRRDRDAAGHAAYLARQLCGYGVPGSCHGQYCPRERSHTHRIF